MDHDMRVAVLVARMTSATKRGQIHGLAFDTYKEEFQVTLSTGVHTWSLDEAQAFLSGLSIGAQTWRRQHA